MGGGKQKNENKQKYNKKTTYNDFLTAKITNLAKNNQGTTKQPLQKQL